MNVNIPEGWRVDHDKDCAVVTVHAPSGRAAIVHDDGEESVAGILYGFISAITSAAPSPVEKPDHTEQPLAMGAEKPKQGEEWTVSVYQHHAENYPRVSLHAPDSGIFSDWFDDVALTISGNFESGEKKIQCADAICAALNFTGNAHHVPENPQWVRCEERMPTEKDSDFEGCIWVSNDGGETFTRWFLQALLDYAEEFVADGSMWHPTGLQRPQPPEGEQ